VPEIIAEDKFHTVCNCKYGNRWTR